MMRDLGIREEDLDDVVFEEEVAPDLDENRWLLIVRVNTDREFSKFWFFKNMRSAWDLARPVKIKTLEDNLFIMKFACLGDWEKVTTGGPWHFRGNAVVFAEYDGFTRPSTIDLNNLDMWIQIHDLPVGYQGTIKALSSKVGKFISLEAPSDDFVGNFVRVRVTVDVRNPLKNHVSLSRAGRREIFLVKYEKLPTWCSVCGMLGHTYKEHGDGIHPPSALVFRNLRASWSTKQGNQPAGGRGRGRGRHGASGRGGRAGGTRDDLGDQYDEEMYQNDYDDEVDDLNRGLEQCHNFAKDPKAKRRLQLELESDAKMLAIEGATKTDLINVKSGKETVVGDLSHCIQDKQNILSTSPSTVQEKKRPKRNGGGDSSEQQKTGSADFDMESDREQ
nr:uncharacterized protein LOC127337946 [Lolium perenne]